MNVAVMIVCGLCMAASFYLVYLGCQAGEGIPWLFAAFGALFGIPFVSGLFKILGRRSAVARRIDEKLSGGQEPRTTFVPHWFMMIAIIAALILILAAIIIPMIVRGNACGRWVEAGSINGLKQRADIIRKSPPTPLCQRGVSLPLEKGG